MEKKPEVRVTGPLAREIELRLAAEEFYNKAHAGVGPGGGRFISGNAGSGGSAGSGKGFGFAPKGVLYETLTPAEAKNRESIGAEIQGARKAAGKAPLSESSLRGYVIKEVQKRSKEASVGKAVSPSAVPAVSGSLVTPFDNIGGTQEQGAKFTPEHKQQIVDALNAIGTVHGVERGLPKVTLFALPEIGEGISGGYQMTESGPQIGLLMGKDTKDSTAYTLVHEFGHHLTLSTGGVGVEGHGAFIKSLKGSGALAGWYSAVQKTDTYKSIVQAGKAAKARGDKTQAGYADYLLMPEEVFARSYAQYITLGTGKPSLMKSINDTAKSNPEHVWGQDEFKDTFAAMDDYITKRGLKSE